MGKLDVHMIRYLTSEDYRVLTAVEMGMKNHEIVPSNLISMISRLRSGGCSKVLRNLCKNKLLCHENAKKVEGFRLTFTGYDYLGIKTLLKQGHLSYFGSQIGVGKESDVYVVQDDDGRKMALKIHRLGRTSFRKLKEKRDYLKHRNNYSWLYLSRLAATKEFAFMKALHNRNFPIPTPVAHNRHCVLMQLMIDHVMLSQLAGDLTAAQCETLYDTLMRLLTQLARHGVIHGDFNEFNLMFNPLDLSDVVIIDFPQMVPTTHPNADWYFDRDVQGIVTFFKRKFGYDNQRYPKLSDIIKSNETVTSNLYPRSVDGLNSGDKQEEGDESEKATNLKNSENSAFDHDSKIDKTPDLYSEAMGTLLSQTDFKSNVPARAEADDSAEKLTLAHSSMMEYFLKSLPDDHESHPDSGDGDDDEDKSMAHDSFGIGGERSSDYSSDSGSVDTDPAELASITPIFAPPKTNNRTSHPNYSDKIVVEIEAVGDPHERRCRVRRGSQNLQGKLSNDSLSLMVEGQESSGSCNDDSKDVRPEETGSTIATTVLDSDVVKRRIQKEVLKKRDQQSSRRAYKAGESRIMSQARRMNNLTIREERDAM